MLMCTYVYIHIYIHIIHRCRCRCRYNMHTCLPHAYILRPSGLRPCTKLWFLRYGALCVYLCLFRVCSVYIYTYTYVASLWDIHGLPEGIMRIWRLCRNEEPKIRLAAGWLQKGGRCLIESQATFNDVRPARSTSFTNKLAPWVQNDGVYAAICTLGYTLCSHAVAKCANLRESLFRLEASAMVKVPR